MSVRVQSENSRLRVVTGTTHNILGAIATKGCLPLADTKTGTISSDPTTADPGNIGNKRIVFGTNTLFLSEVREGDYIYAADVCRKVLYVTSNTQLILEYQFPSTVSGVALKVVRSGKYKIVRASSTGSADAIYQEAKFEFGQVAEVWNDMGLAPVSWDASAGGSEITFELSE